MIRDGLVLLLMGVVFIVTAVAFVLAALVPNPTAPLIALLNVPLASTAGLSIARQRQRP